MKRFLFTFLVWTSLLSINAQEGFVYEDEVYDANIKTIQFHLAGLPTSMPILALKSQGLLVLTFDDLGAGDRFFEYKVIHCDRNWQQSQDVTEIDYLDGFNNEEVDNGFYSQGTRINYTNYELVLPNDDVQFRLSGNYLLLVYDEDTKEPVLTRRFMVSESLIKIEPALGKPVDALLSRSHQDITFKVNHKTFKINRPLQDITATVFQNGRWDNMITGVAPKFNTPGYVHFDRTQRIYFPSLKEFRSFDLRGERSLNSSIHSMDVYSDRIDVLLQLDRSRSAVSQIQESLLGNARREFNGSFIIDGLNLVDPYTQCEYMNVFFNLQVDGEFPNHDVYIIGKLTDWKLKDDFLLMYDPGREVYRRGVELKQGYYDYMYALVDKDTGEIDNSLEGNWYLTENNYHIIIYQRSIGDRYDRIIGVSTLNSFDNRGRR